MKQGFIPWLAVGRLAVQPYLVGAIAGPDRHAAKRAILFRNAARLMNEPVQRFT